MRSESADVIHDFRYGTDGTASGVMEWSNPIRRVPSKYRARRCVVDGRVFASQKEARRYLVLRAQEQAGELAHLICQPTFPITVNGRQVCEYLGDFSYVRDGQLVVEDCKSPVTRTLPLYRLKVKLLQATQGIVVEEV